MNPGSFDPSAVYSKFKKKKAQPASTSYRSINAVKEVDVTGVQHDRVHEKNGPPKKEKNVESDGSLESGQ